MLPSNNRKRPLPVPGRDADVSDAPAGLTVLDYLQRLVVGTLQPGDETQLNYPPPVWQLLGFRLVEVGAARATLEASAAAVHGSQLGTVHGGFLAELSDAAVGTAHSTTLELGQTLTTVSLTVTFLRPVWQGTLLARACPTHLGRTVSHYVVEITREDGKSVASAASTVMTLSGERAETRSRVGLGDRFASNLRPTEPAEP